VEIHLTRVWSWWVACHLHNHCSRPQILPLHSPTSKIFPHQNSLYMFRALHSIHICLTPYNLLAMTTHPNNIKSALDLHFRGVRFKTRPGRLFWLRIIMEFFSHSRSRDSVVSIATGFGLDDRVFGIRVPVRSRIFSSPRRPDLLWGSPSFLFNGYRGLFPRG
jgi:hypothetical protein